MTSINRFAVGVLNITAVSWPYFITACYLFLIYSFHIVTFYIIVCRVVVILTANLTANMQI